MNLTEYAQCRGGSATAACPVFAKVAGAAGCSVLTLYMIARGHKKASGALANRIDQATAGVVKRSVLRPDVFGVPAIADADPDADRIVPVEVA
ncbi:helix-turn-helix domain-containing protein [Xanthomonas prunicola]|uniref:helix-turn-helix domain-containing protein n=1 Tax=Xanthomonas prunicola TaxID=2053930 RepID=UPI002078AE5C|nr:helix-turn-helix domain-containing protein [Xanthomonas prunicola]USJ00891.1 helix-turn-helix domain-containing protein [Xanthomonas prunicola]